MMSKKTQVLPIQFTVIVALLTLNSCNNVPNAPGVDNQTKLELKDATKVSFILTNDIHGQLEPHQYKDGKKIGGMAYFASVVDSIRQQPEYKKDEAALFVLDSGDQFQGSLISNYNEGSSIFKAMGEIGYDAVVPGNHDYDFGPLGWLFDKVTEGKTSSNPREVIEALATSAKFPLLSANTYLKKSIGIDVDAQCRAIKKKTEAATKITDEKPVFVNFEKAERPSFLKPYVILKKADVRVALIGIDNQFTAKTTTIENVSDLCFRDEVETYTEIRRSLEGQADIFVMMIHNGNTDNNKEGSIIVKKINEQIPNGVHLVAAGHTHYVHNDVVDNVRVIQNGDKNRQFGRVDLYFNRTTKNVMLQHTRSKAGIEITHTRDLLPMNSVQAIVSESRKNIESLANRELGEAKEDIETNRIGESALSNLLTDALRNATGAEFAFMNTGGIRTKLRKGLITYEKLFEVLPMSNRAVKIEAMPWSVIKKLLTKSIQTCERYGALIPSGLKVKFIRNCKKGMDVDTEAKLERVETLDGKVLLDEKTEIASSTTFKVATLDFLASGGSGYEDFKEATVSETLEIARELIANELEKTKLSLENKTDGRFENIFGKTK
jgi:2',3'-cyclic-nucleotide 2'-phosphodiesterase (5'-nucleotidase family)